MTRHGSQSNPKGTPVGRREDIHSGLLVRFCRGRWEGSPARSGVNGRGTDSEAAEAGAGVTSTASCVAARTLSPGRSGRTGAQGDEPLAADVPAGRDRHVRRSLRTAPRSGLWRRLPAAALLAAAALLLAAFAFTAPAAAQESGTLVSNNGQTFHTVNHAGNFTKDYATSFTTGGSSEGYTLTGVDLYLRRDSGLTSINLEPVQIFTDSSRRPGMQHGTLTTLGTSTRTDNFNPKRYSGNLKLAAETTYWLVFDESMPSPGHRQGYWISGTNQDDEDSGSFPGWSIGNDRLKRNWNVTAWDSATNDFALRMNLVGYANDRTAPLVRSGRVDKDGTTVTLYYDDALDTGSVPDKARFTVKVAGTDRTVTSVNVSGSKLTLTLNGNAVTANQAVSVSYDADAATTSPLRNWANLRAAKLDGLPVTNDRSETVPTVSGVSIVSTPTSGSSSDTYGVGAQIRVQLTYDGAVTVDTSLGRPRLKIKFHPDFGEKWAVYESGSGSANLVFAYTVVSGNSSSGGSPVTDNGIAVLTNTLQLTGGRIRSEATGRDASLAHSGLSHNSSHKVDGSLDGQAPRVSGASAAGLVIFVDFDEGVDKTAAPAGDSFRATVTSPDGSVKRFPATTTGFHPDININRLLLNFERCQGEVLVGETVRLSYTKPASNPLKDANGNETASFSGRPVTNNSAFTNQAVPTGIAVSQVTDKGHLDVSWTAPDGVYTGYDLRYYQGTEDPPAGREADWIESAPGLPDPGTDTSATFTGLKANTDYLVQVRAKTAKAACPWSDSVGQTTASAPSGNTAPRVLMSNGSTSGNQCQLRSRPLARNQTINAPPGTLVSHSNLTGRRGETTAWPTPCTSRTFVPMFDDEDDVDVGDLTITARLDTLPDNVRITELQPFQQTAVASGDTYNNLRHEGRLFFGGGAALREVTVWTVITATDPHGASASVSQGWIMQALPDTDGAPQLATVSGKTVAAGRAFSLVLPAATGGDTTFGSSDDLTTFPYYYAVSGLPKGLVFDPATREISGTPSETGEFTVTYTADDADDTGSAYLNPDNENATDAATQTFTLTVAPGIELVRVVSAPTHDANGDGKFDTYGVGDKILVDVEFGEPVKVGRPNSNSALRLDLHLGRNDKTGTSVQRQASYSKAFHGGKTLRFAYTVQTADLDPDGVWVQTAAGDAVVIPHNGATVTSVATGANADLTKSGFVTGGAVDGDGVPMTYVNGRLSGAGPQPTGATVNGGTLTVTFDESLDMAAADTDWLPYHLAVSGAGLHDGGNRNAYQHPSKVWVDTDNNAQLKMELNVAARDGDVVTLTYTRVVGPSVGPLRDTAGNMAPSIVDMAVTNSTGGGTDPLIPVRASVAGTTLKIDFNGAIRGGNDKPAGRRFLVETSDVNDDRREIRGTATAVSGSTVTVTLAEPVGPDETALVSYDTSHGLGQWIRGGVHAFDNFQVETVSDLAGPKLVGGAVMQTRILLPRRATVVLYFDEALDPGSVPATGDFTVKTPPNAANAATVSSVAVEGTAVALTVNAVAPEGDKFQVSYTAGTNPIRDFAHNEAADISKDDPPNPLTATAAGTPSAEVAGTGAKLVGNTGESTDNSSSSRGFDNDHAQLFDTGSGGPGFVLTSVVVPYGASAPGASTHEIRIHTRTSAGLPGQSLGTLSYGSESGTTVTYTAPGTGIDLDPGTTYYVVLDTTSDPGSKIKLTNSGDEDPDSAEGWNIHHGRLLRGTSDTTWISSFLVAIQIDIHGYERTWRLKVDDALVTLTYDRPLDPGSVPGPERFTLLKDAGAGETVEYGAVTAVAVEGKVLQLTLENPVSPCDGAAPFTLTYSRSATGNNIRTLSGHQAPDLNAREVTNARAGWCKQAGVVVPADGNPPGFPSQAKSLALKFDGALDTGKSLNASAFALAAVSGAAAPAVEDAAYTEDGTGVVLTLARAIGSGETLTVGYTRPANGAGLWDAEGRQIAGFSGVAVPVAASEPPVATAVEMASNAGEDDTYDLGETIRVRVTFSEAVEVDGSPRLKIDLDPANSWGGHWAVYDSGGGTNSLTFAYTVVEPDESTQGTAVLADSLELDGGAIRSAATDTDADLAHAGLGHDPAHKVDWRLTLADTAAPVAVSAEVDRNRATVTFDEDLAPIDTSILHFFWQVEGPTVVQHPSQVSVSGRVVTMKLSKPVAAGQALMVNHEPSGLADLAGNAVPYFRMEATNLTLPALSVGDARVEEGPEATLDFVVRLGAAVQGTVTVDYATSDGTAVAGEDYTATSGTLAFAAGETVKTVNVPVFEDTRDEGRETLALTLSNPGGGRIVDRQATGTIVNVSPASKPAVTGVAVASRPAAGDTYLFGETIRVTLTFDEAVTVSGTPRLKIDMDPAHWGEKQAAYESGSGTNGLTFAYTVVQPNISTRGIALLASTLTLNGGAIRSADTQADARLAHAGLGHDSAHKVDWRPELSVADARAKEGVDATVAFEVSLSRAATGSVTVDYATADGTATAGEDYTAASGTLSFANGERVKTIAVPVLDDAIDEGEETFTLRLSNARGARITDGEAVGTIENDDLMPKAWTARFGRAVAIHLVDAVDERLEQVASESYLRLGGHQLGGAPQVPEVAERLSPDLSLWEEAEAADPAGQSTTFRELLLGSAFHLVSDDGERAAGPRLSAWGRVATSGFDGREDALTLDGTVTTGTLGVDGVWKRWLTGVLLAYSEGDGSYSESGVGSGDVSSSLTSLHPYLAYRLNDRLRLWGMVGYGSGALQLRPAGLSALDTDLTMTMGALGVRGTLLEPSRAGALQLALRSDVLWMGMDSAAADNLAATEADVSRLRLVLEGSRPVALAGGGMVVPSLEVGLRHDGGDAETGSGIEVGAGLRYASAWGLSIEASVRGLLAHEAEDYTEWGAAGALRFDPGRQGRGLTAAIVPTWGSASSGMSRLWDQSTAAGLAPDDPLATAAAQGRLEAELAYGLVTLKGRALLTPYARVALVQNADQAWHLGTRLALVESLNLSLEASRRGREGGVAAHELALRANLGW